MASEGIEIVVPELGESIVDATVGQWLKQDGETVTEGEPVVELETEKVNMEVVAPASGVLKVTRHEGETVAIGESLGLVGAGDGATQGQGASEAAASTTSTTSATAASNGTGGADGASATASTPAQPATSAPASAPATATAYPPTSNGTHAIAASSVHATPLARRVAEEHGVDLATLRGSGPSGSITREDVSAYLAGTPAATTANVAPAPTAPAAPATPAAPKAAPAPVAPARPTPPPAAPAAPVAESATGRPEERVRMSRRRQTIAQRLKETQNRAAMLTTFNEVDMSAILDIRKRRRDAFKERYGVSLGFMSFFTRAVIGALKAYPRLNAEIDGTDIILKHYYDIGIAVSTDEGLVVPVVRDADRMTFAEIERTIAELARKARAGTLTLDDLRGGTFTITNGGIFGSLLSTPILNGTQVGILGMHKIEERPIAVNGQVVIHPMMYVAVSYDHRIVDGAESVGFLVRVKQLLEDPETLLLEG